MKTLTTLKLPIGSATERLVLTQQQVETLIRVYYDNAITTKEVSGYVHKDTITYREYHLLTALGLDVTYDELINDQWSMAASPVRVRDGQQSTVTVEGLPIEEVSLSLTGCTVELGSLTETQALALATLTGNTLAFDVGNYDGNAVVRYTIEGTPVYGGATKTVVIEAVHVVSIHSVYINRADGVVNLESEGSKELIDDYIHRCKCYLFSGSGGMKAEIKSATFVGDYSGMTSGTVILADDTQVAIQTLNTKGVNWMVLRPEMHILSSDHAATHTGEVLKNTGIYDVFGDSGGKVFPKKYIGMFKGFLQGDVLKSQPNRIPTGANTIANFFAKASAGGRGYGLWNYSDWCRENALHLSWYDCTNYERNVGIGRINNYNAVRNIVTGFTLPLVGMYDSGAVPTVDSQGNTVNCLNFFGIEGLGEQIWEFVIGFRHDGTTAYVWDENVWSETQEGRTFPLGAKQNGYIKEVIGGEHFDMMPRSVGGIASSSTGYCDQHWYAANGRLLLVGGDANSGSGCGLSASSADDAFSYSHAHTGARLAFYGEPETVSGSEFVAKI